MPRRDRERLADEFLRTLRPAVLQALDATFKGPDDSDPDADQDPEVEAKAARWAARHHQRDRMRRQPPAKPARAQTRRGSAK